MFELGFGTIQKYFICFNDLSIFLTLKIRTASPIDCESCPARWAMFVVQFDVPEKNLTFGAGYSTRSDQNCSRIIGRGVVL